MHELSAIVMAGGKGTRMQSDYPKVLQPLGGRPMIFHTLDLLQKLQVTEILVVVSYMKDEIIKQVSQQFQVSFALQKEPIGTANAVSSALEHLKTQPKAVLVLGGDDSAFYTTSTLLQFISSHHDTAAQISMMTLLDPLRDKVGKVFRNQDGQFEQLLEYSDYSNLNLTSDEVNCGVYLIDLNWLKENLPKVKKNPIKGEYYLTDLLNIANSQNDKINLFLLQDRSEWFGINTADELATANKLWQSRKDAE